MSPETANRCEDMALLSRIWAASSKDLHFLLTWAQTASIREPGENCRAPLAEGGLSMGTSAQRALPQRTDFQAESGMNVSQSSAQGCETPDGEAPVSRTTCLRMFHGQTLDLNHCWTDAHGGIPQGCALCDRLTLVAQKTRPGSWHVWTR